MRLTKTKKETLELVDFSGLFSGIIRHEIKESTATMSYTGPKINPERWREVLAFFHHVNSTSHSECQVRIFFDPIVKEFIFWAAPQESCGGLSTKEINNADATRQRAELPNSAGLIAIGTAHSHCDISAFASGTDIAGETNNDGIHITIGKLNQPVFDFHARVFLKKGCMFDVSMDKFWDIGEIKNQLPEELHDKIARFQMCKKPENMSFPKQWADNLIEIPKPAVTTYGGHFGDWRSQGFTPNEKTSRSLRLKDAIFDLRRELHGYNLNNEEVVEAVREIAEEPIAAELIRVCVESGLEPHELLEEMEKKDSKPEKDIDPYQEAMMDYMGQ